MKVFGYFKIGETDIKEIELFENIALKDI